MKGSDRPLLLVILVAIISAASGCASARQEAMRQSPATGSSSSTASASEASLAPITVGKPPSSAGPPDFTSSVARQRTSVVSIAAIRPSDTNSNKHDEGVRIELFRRLNPHSTGLPPRTASRVNGSGFIVSDDGYILTNAHLVSGASIVNVILASGEHYSAQLAGIDRATDIAVLKIDAQDLSVVTLGDPHRLRAGQWVTAIGSPFGFEQSVAVGVVSALERILPGDDSYTPFIQTDLPLNPGHSGGPLFDEAGNVVGINTQVVFTGSGIAGISFAIPIDLAVSVADQLIRSGHIDRAELGIGFQDVDQQLSQAFDSPAGGVLLHTVAADGPAEKAGLRAGDIILALDGRNVGSARQLAAAIAALVPGSPTAVTVWRGGVRSELLVRTADTPASSSQLSGIAARTVSHTSELVAVHELSAKTQRLLGTEGYLLIMAVSERAAAAGIEVGDILLAVDGRLLRTSAELRKALDAGSRPVALLVDRNGDRMFIAVSDASPAPGHSANDD